MNHLLEVKNLSYAYHTLQGETLVLDRVSFSIEPGEFVAIVGPSGCGKSTLLSLICRLLQPDQGTILLQENKKTGYMLQKDHLLEWRTTHKNIALGPEITHQTADGLPQKIDNMLKKYQLDGFRNAKPNQLSGGMRQRAALIRTLMLEPDLLLLDEPFSALDYQTRLSVSDEKRKQNGSSDHSRHFGSHQYGRPHYHLIFPACHRQKRNHAAIKLSGRTNSISCPEFSGI